MGFQEDGEEVAEGGSEEGRRPRIMSCRFLIPICVRSGDKRHHYITLAETNRKSRLVIIPKDVVLIRVISGNRVFIVFIACMEIPAQSDPVVVL